MDCHPSGDISPNKSNSPTTPLFLLHNHYLVEYSKSLLGEIELQRYIVLINFTDQGMKKIKNLPKRVQAARKTIEKVGGTFVSWNLTMGPYDSVAIVELPDDTALAPIILGVGKDGFIETTTLKAFSETEAAKIVTEIS